MAFKRSGGNKPEFSIRASVSPRKGKYVNGPSAGLWLADNGPMARGSLKENYLEEFISFLQKAAKNDMSVSLSLFKNDSKKRSRDEDEDEDGEWGSKRKAKARDEEEEEEEKPAAKKKRKPVDEEEEEEEKPAKKSKKKSDWDFD